MNHSPARQHRCPARSRIALTPKNPAFCLLLSLFLMIGCSTQAHAQDAAGPSVVRILKQGDRWALERNGEPYFIKGGGGYQHLDALAELGGNSIRTWGADNAGEILDQAHAHGITVTVGIWLGHERHGFNYSDKDAVEAQLQTARRFVEQYKDHPALLMWGLGNEMEGGDGGNPLIWQAINDIAKMVKQVDPNHPTMTVIAEIGGQKLPNLMRYCPDIDVLGINSYGGLPSLGQRTREAGLDRPYVVTEFGPLGQWETGKTPWGVPYEQNSSEKAKFCAEGYSFSIKGQPGRCLGGYVFNWGNKQEVTPTWYSLFLKDTHETTETVDVISKFWTGDWPANRAPLIQSVAIQADDTAHIKPGQPYTAHAQAADPDGDNLDYHWIIQSETTDRRSGGDLEQAPPTHPELTPDNGQPTLRFNAPDEPGPYRLFVYIKDNHAHAATANIPFFVE